MNKYPQTWALNFWKQPMKGGVTSQIVNQAKWDMVLHIRTAVIKSLSNRKFLMFPIKNFLKSFSCNTPSTCLLGKFTESWRLYPLYPNSIYRSTNYFFLWACVKLPYLIKGSTQKFLLMEPDKIRTLSPNKFHSFDLSSHSHVVPRGIHLGGRTRASPIITFL